VGAGISSDKGSTYGGGGCCGIVNPPRLIGVIGVVRIIRASPLLLTLATVHLSATGAVMQTIVLADTTIMFVLVHLFPPF